MRPVSDFPESVQDLGDVLYNFEEQGPRERFIDYAQRLLDALEAAGWTLARSSNDRSESPGSNPGSVSAALKGPLEGGKGVGFPQAHSSSDFETSIVAAAESCWADLWLMLERVGHLWTYDSDERAIWCKDCSWSAPGSFLECATKARAHRDEIKRGVLDAAKQTLVES